MDCLFFCMTVNRHCIQQCVIGVITSVAHIKLIIQIITAWGNISDTVMRKNNSICYNIVTENTCKRYRLCIVMRAAADE